MRLFLPHRTPMTASRLATRHSEVVQRIVSMRPVRARPSRDGFLGMARGFLRPFLKVAKCALLAVVMAPVAAAQETPVDPVTGMAIPMLPGQFYVKSPSGCWMITDEGLLFDQDHQQFIGSCTFGVVNGPGLLAPIQNSFHPAPLQPYDYRPFRAEFGDVPGFERPGYDSSSSWDVYAPRTSTHSSLEMLEFYRRTIEHTSDLLQPKAEEAREQLVKYKGWKNRTQTEQTVEVLKTRCPSWNYQRNRHLSRAEMQEEVTQHGFVPKEDVPRVVDFCWKQLARLQSESGGRQMKFDNLAFGYYFVAATFTSYDTWSANGRDRLGERRLQVTQGCPDLGTLTGCERVWQAMLAPFITLFDDLKRQEVALTEQHRAEQKQRFAPLAQAWRTKILAATGAAPAGSN